MYRFLQALQNLQDLRGLDVLHHPHGLLSLPGLTSPLHLEHPARKESGLICELLGFRLAEVV